MIWRLTALLMGRPVSCEENLRSSSTSEKSWRACSGVMRVPALAFSVTGAGLDCGAAGAVCCAEATVAAARQNAAAHADPRLTYLATACCSFIDSPSWSPRGPPYDSRLLCQTLASASKAIMKMRLGARFRLEISALDNGKVSP